MQIETVISNSEIFQFFSGLANLAMAGTFVFFARAAYKAAEESGKQRDKLIGYLEKMASDVLLRKTITLKEGLDTALKEIEDKENKIKTLEEQTESPSTFYKVGLSTGLLVANQTIRNQKEIEEKEETKDPMDSLVNIIVESSNLISEYSQKALESKFAEIPINVKGATLCAVPQLVAGRWFIRTKAFNKKGDEEHD